MSKAIEGVDGSGKTELAARLYRRLVASGRATTYTHEPSNLEIGGLLTGEVLAAWARGLEVSGLVPDLTLILSVSQATARERRRARRTMPDAYDRLQERCSVLYDGTLDLDTKSLGRVVIVDANGSPERVEKRAAEAVTALLAEKDGAAHG